MSIDIGAVLAEMFYEHEQVHIPGVGAFVLERQPALIDQIQAQIHPPGKQVKFNPHLQLDDGLLKQYLQDKYGLSAADAEARLEAFSTDIRERLAAKQLIELPGIGRLYNNYENNIQFLPDAGNYDSDTYGLPILASYPVIHRERATSPTAAAAAPLPERRLRADQRYLSKDISGWLQRNIVWLSVLTLLIIAVGTYLLVRDGNRPADDPLAGLPEDRVNVSPDDEDLLEEDELNAIVPPGEEVAPYEGDMRYAVIAIGLFADDNNVKRLLRRIAQAGYDPYTKLEAQGTRVGVQVRYQDEIELQNHLNEVRRSFNDKAFILEEGEG